MTRRVSFMSLLLVLTVTTEDCVAQKSTAATQKPPEQTEPALLTKGAKKLAATDFAALYVGNTLTGTTSDGDAFHVFVESATAYRMEFQGKRTTDKWHVGKDGEFCSISGGETTCTREYALEQAIHSFNPDSTYAGTARIRPGNPEKL